MSHEATLRHLVGAPTLERGRDIVRRGAVLSARWQESGERVVGRVLGTSPVAYSASAQVVTSIEGQLTGFRGGCTCPVGIDCKHAVALVLAALAAQEPGGQEPGGQAVTPGRTGARIPAWEVALRDLASAGTATAAAPAVALQCELVPGGGGQPELRLALRPALLGRSGSWVRSGISWSSLDHVHYARPDTDQDHLRLLQEVRAIARAGTANSYYGYGGGPAVIHLDEVATRGIWDLLEEARDAGLPVVQAGRQGAPVVVTHERAELTVDLRRDADGLQVRPLVTVGAEECDPGAALLVGTPAHGLVWWPPGHGEEGAGGLRLSRFAAPVPAALGQVIDRRRLVVPAADEARFFAAYYPVLRRRVEVSSRDGSVEVPELAAPRLTLTVEHLAGQRVGLAWQWVYAVGDAVRSEPLWPQPAGAAMRDPDAEAAALGPVLDVTHALPALRGDVPGARLLPAVTLAGMPAVRFVADALPGLQALPGLEVEVRGDPVTYRESTATPEVAVSSEAVPGDRDWFDLAVTVRVEGEEVPFEPLFVALATGQTHLVLASGTFFALDRPELAALAALIAEARSLQDGQGATARVSRWQAGMWDELDRLGVISGQAAAWQRSIRALTHAADLPAPAVPATLRATLRPYQLGGFHWLAFLYDRGLGGILADEMGLGKTLQALALMLHVRGRSGAGTDPGPFLVVAPTSVVANWAAECARFAPDLAVRTITETGARRGFELAELAAEADVVLTSYTLFRLEHDDYAALGWSGLFLDEAQFAKNHQSRAYACAKQLSAPFKVAITGTPMENNLMELWALLSLTAPGLFPSPVRFEQTYRTPIERGRDPDLLDRLRRRIAPLVLRRTKAEVLRDLPDKQEQVLDLALNPRHRRIYQTHLQRERQKVLGLLADLDGNRFEIFRSLTLLRQASLDPGLVNPAHAGVPSTKLDALMELVTEVVSEGHRTLVFSQFTRFLDAAQARLAAAGVTHCRLDGSTRNRAGVLARWKGGDDPVFLISLKAGGTGLNLTEADYCILLDPWWNPATEAQAVDRVHRIGQTKKVMVYRLVAKDTIEEKVVALKEAKAALVGSVLDGGTMASGALTAADIRGLVE